MRLGGRLLLSVLRRLGAGVVELQATRCRDVAVGTHPHAHKPTLLLAVWVAASLCARLGWRARRRSRGAAVLVCAMLGAMHDVLRLRGVVHNDRAMLVRVIRCAFTRVRLGVQRGLRSGLRPLLAMLTVLAALALLPLRALPLSGHAGAVPAGAAPAVAAVAAAPSGAAVARDAVGVGDPASP